MAKVAGNNEAKARKLLESLQKTTAKEAEAEAAKKESN
jgi:hypothetical protein